MSTVSEGEKEGENTVNHGIAENPLKAGQNYLFIYGEGVSVKR